jgi:hypothetical protein
MPFFCLYIFYPPTLFCYPKRRRSPMSSPPLPLLHSLLGTFAAPDPLLSAATSVVTPWHATDPLRTHPPATDRLAPDALLSPAPSAPSTIGRLPPGCLLASTASEDDLAGPLSPLAMLKWEIEDDPDV